MRRHLLPAAAVAAALVLDGCGLYIGTTPPSSAPTAPAKAHKTTKQQATARSAAPTVSQGSSGRTGTGAGTSAPSTTTVPAGNVTVTVPVVSIPMSYGIPGEGKSPPETVRVTMPPQWQGKLWAYWANQVILAPAGWTGSGSEGADGSEEIALFPKGGGANYGERVTLQGDGACVGCGAPDAAQYFQQIQQNWSQYAVLPNSSPPAMVQVQAETSLSPDLIAYELAPEGDLEVNGLAFTGLLSQGASYLTFENMRTYLPQAEHSMATVILNWEIGHNLQ